MHVPKKLEDKYEKQLLQLLTVIHDSKIKDEKARNYLCHFMLAYRIAEYNIITSLGVQYLITNKLL